MELPKNTTQIGEIQGNYKIFIEDYVISYLKQLCRQEPDRKKRIAFYGVLRTEGEVQYYFIYGGCEVPRHSEKDNYLSERDFEEIIWAADSFFKEYTPIGYVTLEEELPEGIRLLLGERGRYIQGYHIFYEKNESMLAFMIHNKVEREEQHKEQSEPAQVLTKPQIQEASQSSNIAPLKKTLTARQTISATTLKEKEEPFNGKIYGLAKSAAMALFVVLCVIAVSTMNGKEKLEAVQDFFQRGIQAMTEKKLPDKQPNNMEVYSPGVENTKEVTKQTISENQTEDEKEENTIEENVIEENAIEENAIEENTETVTENQSVTHIIQKGETLNSISNRYYGNKDMVKEISELNGIANADNIQVGQKIILP